MNEFVIPTPPVPSVPVEGGGRWPVRRIFCVGRNYAAHAREMGNDERDPPFFFTKPADAVIDPGPVPYPPLTEDLHHEVELVVAIAKEGSNIKPELADNKIFGYAVGVDLTRRDLQAEAKKRGRPWDMAKGFDHSAPMSAIVRVETVGHPGSGSIYLSVNGETRQNGDLGQQVWKVPEIVSELSKFVRLMPGDLIMTGTPAGVGNLKPGDRVEAGIDNVGEVAFTMGPPSEH